MGAQRLGVLVVLATLLAACTAAPSAASPSAITSTAAASASASPTPVEVKVAYQAILALAPMYVAEDKGFFAAYGIKNTYNLVGSAYDVIPQVSQGQLDVNAAVAGSAAWFNAINSGLNITAIAARLRYTCASDSALVVRTALYNQGIKSVSDMRGKKVAILSRGSAIEYWLQQLLKSQGMSLSDLGNVTVLGFPDTLNAMKTGAVDFSILSMPVLGSGVADGTVKIIQPIYKVVPNSEVGFIASSANFLKQDGGRTAANWVAGFLKGARYYEDPANKTDVINIIAKWTKVDASLLADAYGTDQWAWAPPNGQLNVNDVLSQAQWQLDNKLIQAVPPANKWYDEGPVTAALKTIGTVSESRDCSSVPTYGAK